MPQPVLPDDWENYPDEDKLKLLQQYEQLAYQFGLKVRPWRETARNKQLPPDDPKHHLPDAGGYTCGCGGVDDDWRIWILLTGRAFGKTQTGSNWLIEQALANPGTAWGVAAPTTAELDSVCFNGDSGLRHQLLPGEEADFNKNKRRLELSNGAVIQGFSADRPDRIRGQNLYGLWWDEAASSRFQDEFWRETARLAVRKGEKARIVITTTPRSTRLLRDMVDGKYRHTHITKGKMWENTTLDAALIADYQRDYANSRLGRQELEGELLDDFEGALFSRDDIDKHRIIRDDLPTLTRIVVAVDPAMKSGEDSDETGIIVAGEAETGGVKHAYIVDDRSMKGSPQQVMRAVAATYNDHAADCVVIESNQGGEYVRDALRTVDASIPVRQVHSMRSKIIRAQPVSTLMEQGRLHMAGSFPELEDQMCVLMPGEKSAGHDDRADAMVYCLYELKHISQTSYLDAYGMMSCPECAKAHHKKQERCPHCGHVRPAEPEPAPVEAAEFDRGWASAYVDRCADCGETYARGLPACPKCHVPPETAAGLIGQLAHGGLAGWPRRRGNLAGMWRRGR